MGLARNTLCTVVVRDGLFGAGTVTCPQTMRRAIHGGRRCGEAKIAVGEVVGCRITLIIYGGHLEIMYDGMLFIGLAMVFDEVDVRISVVSGFAGCITESWS